MTPRRPLDETSRHFNVHVSRLYQHRVMYTCYALCCTVGTAFLFFWHPLDWERGILHRYHCEFLPGFFFWFWMSHFSSLCFFLHFLFFCTKHIGRRARIDVPSMA